MKKSSHTIFYSWQNDLPSKDNRYLIEQSIKYAIKKNKDEVINMDPSLDRDTKGLPGTPAIADSILNKIDSASLFIADISIICDQNSLKPCLNPNVAIELGFAAKSIGWERIILIMNTYYGETNTLPFDLKHRRWPICYNLSPTASKNFRKSVQLKLTGDISNALKTSIKNGLFTKNLPINDIRLALLLSNAILPLQNTIRQFATPKTHSLFDNYDNWLEVPRDLSHPDRQKINSELLSPIAEVFRTKSIYQDMQINDMCYADQFILDIEQALIEINKAIDRYPQQNMKLTEFGYSLESNLTVLLSSIKTYKIYQASKEMGISSVSHLFNHLLVTFISARIIFGEFLGYF
jgi:hypothetical protein